MTVQATSASPFMPSFGSSKPKRSNSRSEELEGEDKNLPKLEEVPETEDKQPTEPLQEKNSTPNSKSD